ncbi:MAG: phenylacetate--CoA ligase family protein [Deltaproteobacteria bacterium]|nr:phenylacetate--CoA ligase family protein [Deltaproteobacteria bacterium]
MAIDFRIRDFCYPIRIWTLRRFLERSQYQEPQVLRSYQERRLQNLVDHAYRNVPYYRGLFDSIRLKPSDIKTLADLSKLPVLSKETLRTHLKDLIAVNARRFLPRLYRTSGSTGTPLTIYNDRVSNALEFATYWWHWGWGGYRMGDRFLAIRPVPFRLHPRLKNHTWHFDPRIRCLYLSSLRFDPKEAEQYAERIRKFKPRFLKARPTVLYLFASALRERAIRDLHFRAVFTGGVNLLERDIKLARDVFHSKVYDSYGLMERVANIRQCEYGSYHINQVYGVVEVLDEKGDPATPGKRGRIVATGLHNWAMPLIRYDTKDFCVPDSEETCQCGRTLPTVRSVYGFTEDPVITPDGRSLTALGTVFNAALGIKMGQIVQTTRDRIEVHLVRDTSYKDEDGEAVVRELHSRVGDGMDLKLFFVNHIEPTEEGKFKWVRSEIL